MDGPHVFDADPDANSYLIRDGEPVAIAFRYQQARGHCCTLHQDHGPYVPRTLVIQTRFCTIESMANVNFLKRLTNYYARLLSLGEELVHSEQHVD